MDAKRTASIVGVLAVLAAIAAGFFTLKWMGPEAAAPERHALQGTLTPAGDFAYSESDESVEIEASYPAQVPLPSAAASRAAQSAMEDWVAASIAEFKTRTAEYLTPDERQRLQEMGLSYALGLEYEPYRSDRHASYRFTVYEDTGGAHPNAFFRTFVFDQEGRELGLADLFEPGSDYLERMAGQASAQVEDELRRRIGAEPGDAFFDEGTAPLPENFQNFVLDGDELAIFIPPYQAAAYAAGFFEVRIPLSGFSDILAPGIR